MTIEKYASRKVVTISEYASLFEAASMMKKENIGAVVIVKDNNNLNPIGMLTDRDIVTKLIADKASLEDINVKDTITNDLLTISEGDSFESAIEALAKKGVRRAPLVDKNNFLIGLITLDDLLIRIIKNLNSLLNVVEKQVASNKTN